MMNRTLNKVLFFVILGGLFLNLCTGALVRSARERRLREAEEQALLAAAEAEDPDGEASGTGPGYITSGPGSAVKPERSSLYDEYLRKFRDTDETIERMKAGRKKSGEDADADAARELRYWETQLNSLYQTVMDMLSDQEAAVLQRDQQDWRNSREEAAAKAVRQKGRNSGERADYLAAQAESTRARAWELLERYRTELSGALRYGPGGRR